MAIALEPDWKEGVELALSFHTALDSSARFVEQRRPLVAGPMRYQRCQFTFQLQDSQRALNILKKYALTPTHIPIYSEPFFCSVITQGASAVTSVTDLSNYWNLQNGQYIIILDFVTGSVEYKTISSVVGNVINLTSPILGLFLAATCVLYPAMYGVVSGLKEKLVTSQVASYDTEFSEYVPVGVAAPVWVGLQEIVCPEDLISSFDCSEYFNGVNGAAYSQELYTVNLAGGADPTIYDNMLKFSGAVGGTRRYSATFSFLGEFDIYLDFHRGAFGEDESGSVGLILNNETEAIYFAWGSIWYAEGTGYSVSGIASDVEVPAPNAEGKLRLRRNATNGIYAYYWNNTLSRWEWDGDVNGTVIGFITGPATPGFYVSRILVSDVVSIGDVIVTEGCDNTQPVE